MDIGIIGGGMMGLATAFYLSKAGASVTVFEKNGEIGGLSASEEIVPGVRWDRFYHVILTGDDDLLGFLGDIGLSGDIRFSETRTGFYTDGALHSMSSTAEFLKFRPLSLWNKLRLGAGIFYASGMKNAEPLGKIGAEEWLVRVFGRENYEKMWSPLLGSKLGAAKDRASAFFIWACIARYYGTRQAKDKKEMMGCVSGGYDRVIKRLRERLEAMGAHISAGCGVDRVMPLESGELCLQCDNGTSPAFDQVVATVPNARIAGMWPDMPGAFRGRLAQVEYLSLICVTLVLKRILSPFYVTNLTDSGFPFTGVIEATHVVPPEILDGKALVYLPRYMVADDPFFSRPDHEVLAVFLRALRRIFPDFRNEDILGACVNRASEVQPIQEVGYLEKMPSMETPLENFHMVNTAMISDSTLNNNQVIRLARRMADRLLAGR
ncbi:amine oxidase [Desulfonema ishimotonii]|uniref:Amine oxidase n=1 Tax=Desulfonema ishimotonii TaxID=45657 RepID=A0A401FVD3_9BACT|nr:FAD-dependent oxidoreductase [Desulfonema ishimotonii]GBC60937.1 amine oxidase [Desulfonema ishimotonii]